MSLKSKTINGFKWSLIDTILKYFLTFFISIILARLLMPADYGLIAIVGVFMAFSRVFIDGGFSDALIRKKDCTIADYSSVFIFNLILASSFYVLLFFFAPHISHFFQEPQLTRLIRVSGLGLLIGATSTIQVIILKKILNFKLLAIIGLCGTIISGTVSIFMAFNGFGVWSLVWSGIISSSVSAILLWIFNYSSIKLIFNISLIKEHFNFGSKIMLGSFIHAVYDNMYNVLIGKIYNPSLLGYYTRADNFQKLFSNNIDIIVRQVTYPVLSQIQNDHHKLKETYQVLIRSTAFITFILLIGLFIIAEPFIVILIGEKWLPSVPLLKMLCFAGLFMPLISINTNILNVKGRSDLSLLVVIIKVLLAVPSLALGYYYGLYTMIGGILVGLLINYMIVMYLSKMIIGYSVTEQLKDLLPTIKLVLFAFTPVYFISFLNNLSSWEMIIIQVFAATILVIGFGELFKNREYILLKSIIIKKRN